MDKKDKETNCLEEEPTFDSVDSSKMIIKEECDISENNPQKLSCLPGARIVYCTRSQPTRVSYECQICKLCFMKYDLFRKHVENHDRHSLVPSSTLSQNIKIEKNYFGCSDNISEKDPSPLYNGATIKEEINDFGYPDNTVQESLGTRLCCIKEENGLGESQSGVGEDHFAWSDSVKEGNEVIDSKETFDDAEYNIVKDNAQSKTMVTEDCDTIEKNVNKPNNLPTDGNTKKDKSHRCDRCGKYFTRSSTLKDHYRIHTGEKPFQCETCKKSFTDRGSLRGHRVTHTNGTTFKCNVCYLRFFKLSKLLLHNVNHKMERPFVCNQCGKCFRAQKNLTLHEVYHSGNKPYQCDVCEKSYGQRSHLQTHVRTHTKEKPCKCDICGKCFPEKSTLVKHNRIHTGEKIYKCTICNIYFTFNNSLQRHMELHDKREPSTLVCSKQQEKNKPKVVSMKLKRSIFRKEKSVHNGQPVTVVFFNKK